MKISLTLDLTKINKNKIVERSYQNKAGLVQTVKDYKVDVVELQPDKQKVLRTNDTWELVKTHLVFEQQTKEEKAQNVRSTIVGEGTTIRDITPQSEFGTFEKPKSTMTSPGVNGEPPIDLNDIGF